MFSIALQFCEIVQWMNNYKKENPNKKVNLEKCKPIIKETTDLLKENTERLGLTNVKVSVSDATENREELHETADLVIADVPCSKVR